MKVPEHCLVAQAEGTPFQFLSLALTSVSVLQPAKEKRKVGRPIAYCGDPNSPDLTPAERRRIKRRIANRESARRVRARRQDMIEEMAIKARQMEDQNMQLANHASTVEQQHAAMMAQLGEFNQRLQQTTVENEQLAKEISCLRNAVNNVRFSASAWLSLCLAAVPRFSACRCCSLAVPHCSCCSGEGKYSQLAILLQTSMAPAQQPKDIGDHMQPTMPMPVSPVNHSSSSAMGSGSSALPMASMPINTQGEQRQAQICGMCASSALCVSDPALHRGQPSTCFLLQFAHIAAADAWMLMRRSADCAELWQRPVLCVHAERVHSAAGHA